MIFTITKMAKDVLDKKVFAASRFATAASALWFL